MSHWRAVCFSAIALVIVFASGFAVSSIIGGGDVTAQDAKTGPWTAIMPPTACSYYCDLKNVDSQRVGDMTNFASLGEVGDPNGSPLSAINIIAKLDQDGCEWQWQSLGDRVVILYRC
jgi:hypothetical protein